MFAAGGGGKAIARPCQSDEVVGHREFADREPSGLRCYPRRYPETADLT